MFKSKNESNIIVYKKCTVRLLEDSDILQCEFQHFHKGSYLIDYLCEELQIKEKDYFGLRYVDTGKQRQWLDLAKSIAKQCKDIDPILFSFRVKFYPADPFRLTGNGRLMLYQQLKRDLRHGRLYCSIGEAAALGSLIVQEEMGDYIEDIHAGDYVSTLHLAFRQTDILEKKIIDLHKKREPFQDPTITIDEFLGIARGLETYGIDPHPVKDHRGSLLYIGINYTGISTFVAGKRSQHFRWNEVQKLNFEGKMFIAHLSYTDASREPKKHTVGYKCSSGAACRYLWRCAIEMCYFFTLPHSQNAFIVSGGGFFSWGTKFKYTGRTEREILTESINALREQKMTSSTTSKRKASSVPATPSSPQGDLAQIRYSSLPRSTMSEPLGNCIMLTTDHLGNIMYGNHQHDGVLEPVSEEARLRTSNVDRIDVANGEIPEFYFRDSLEHSSTESGIINAYDDGTGRSLHNQINTNHHTIYTKKHQTFSNFPINSRTSANSAIATGVLHNGINKKRPPTTVASIASKLSCQKNLDKVKSIRKFNFLRAFIPCLIFVVFIMVVSAVLVFEMETEMFEQFQSVPEMITLRYQYYQPIKDFLLKKFYKKI